MQTLRRSRESFDHLEVKLSLGKLGTVISSRCHLNHILVATSLWSHTKLYVRAYYSGIKYAEELNPEKVDKLCKECRLEEAFDLVRHLLKHGFFVTRDHIYSLLQGCVETNNLEFCNRIYFLMVYNGFDCTSVLVDHLIRLYTSSNGLQDASRLFGRCNQPTIYTWNALLTAHTKLGEGQTALSLFHEMSKLGMEPDKVTFLCALKACSNVHDINSGRLVHKQIYNSEYESDIMLRNAIINMYAKCGELQEASTVFDSSLGRDIVSWGAMIMGYAQHGQALPALNLFVLFIEHGFKVSKVVFLGVLKACSISSAGCWGMLIHSELIQSLNTPDLVLNNSLIDMYTKCGLLNDAQSLFECMEWHDEVSLGTMIAGFVIHKDPERALWYFDQMQRLGLMPSINTFCCLMKACGLLGNVVQGMQMHQLFVLSGTNLDMMACSSLVDMYIKCQALPEARNLFNALPYKDLVLWGSMIEGYCTLGPVLTAFELFGQMQECGIQADSIILNALLKGCSEIGTVVNLMLLQCYVNQVEIDAYKCLEATFIEVYAKVGCLKEAYRTFGGLQNRNPMSWCSIIIGYIIHGCEIFALDLFVRMRTLGMEPNRLVLLCALQACGNLGLMYQSLILHDDLIRGNHEGDAAIANTLINTYSKCGSLEVACKVFEISGTLDAVQWGTMLGAYVMHGQYLKGLELLWKLQDKEIQMNVFMLSSVLKACGALKEVQKGRHMHIEMVNDSLEMDTVLGNSLILMYSRQGHLEDAYWVLTHLQTRDAVSWATIIAAHSENNHAFLAMQAFEKMQNEGLCPSVAALVSTLKACASIGALPQGRIVHNLTVACKSEADLVVGSALVELYSRSGRTDEAWQVLSKLPCQDSLLWGALIAGCTHHGKSRLVSYYFHEMLGRGIMPDSGVFTGLLTACSQEGLMKEACDLLNQMHEDYNVVPGTQHYTCIIDLFGRVGCFDKAKDIIEMMPPYPDTVIWMSLLTSCRTYSSVRIANWCFHELLKLEAVDAACYILMSSIYSDADLWQDAKKVCQLICSSVVKTQQPEIAWFEMGNGIHEFKMGGDNNPQRESVGLKLHTLGKQLRNKGFVVLLNHILEPSEAGWYSEQDFDTAWKAMINCSIGKLKTVDYVNERH